MKMRSFSGCFLAVLAAAMFVRSAPAGVDDSTGAGLEGGQITQLVVDPRDSSILHAANNTGGFFTSTDGGATWRSTHTFFTLTDLIYDPTDSDTLYVSASYISRSTDNGASWTPVRIPGAEFAVWAVGVDPGDPATLYAAAVRFDLYKSTDGGVSWSKPAPLMRLLTDVAVDYFDSNIVYAVPGLDKSTDGGATWVSYPIGALAEKLILDPTDPDILYAITREGPYRSTTAGETWESINPIQTSPTPTPSPCSLPPLQNESMSEVIRSAPEVLYVSTCDGVYKSVDRGDHWTRTALSTPVDVVAVDPRHADIVYGVGNDGLFKSTDGGDTWLPASAIVDDSHSSGSDGCSIIATRSSHGYAGVLALILLAWIFAIVKAAIATRCLSPRSLPSAAGEFRRHRRAADDDGGPLHPQ